MNDPHNEEVCANCGRYYDQHLLYDGNKCHTGSITGWFPKSIADTLETMKPKEFTEKPICDRTIPGSYRFSKGFVHCNLPFDHLGKCSGLTQDERDAIYDDHAKNESGHHD